MPRSIKLSITGEKLAREKLEQLGFKHRSLRERTGFARSTVSNFLNRQPVDKEYFNSLCNVLQLDPQRVQQREDTTRLKQWCCGKFEAGWLSCEQLFSINSQLDLEFVERSGVIRRFKEICMSSLTGSFPLMIAITPKTEETLRIQVSLFSLSSHVPLPSNIELSLINHNQSVQYKVRSGEDDQCLSLPPIPCNFSQEFGVRVAYDGAAVIEWIET